MIEIPRRRFLIGLAGLVAAPAIVRVGSLMPVKALPAPLIYSNRTIRTWADIERAIRPPMVESEVGVSFEKYVTYLRLTRPLENIADWPLL